MSTDPSKSISILFILVIGILSTIGYIYIATLSGDPLNPTFPEDWAITHFLVTIGMLFFLYGMLVVRILKGNQLQFSGVVVAAGFCVLFRVILLPTELILENDIYRYIWDGHVLSQGINPFEYSPDDPALLPYRTKYWASINYPYVPTVYPPTLQYVFYGSNFLFPGSVTGMKIILVLFDIGTVGFLYILLQKLSLPKEWCLIYAWSPLVIKEVANSGHADSVSAFLLVLLLTMLSFQRNALCAVVMGLFVLTKFFGILLLPLFLRFWRIQDYFIFMATIFLLYIPFFQWDVNLMEGFFTFSKEWRFNSGLFAFAETLLVYFKLAGYFQAEQFTRYIMASVIGMVAVWQSITLYLQPSVNRWVQSAFIITGTLLVCSPVINAWYLVWMLPLICLRPNRAWIIFTGLVFLSYVYYYEWLFMGWVKPIEFGIFFLLLFDDWLWNVVSGGSYQPTNLPPVK